MENASSIIDIQPEGEECCVCYETITKKLVCGHYIHATCVARSGKLRCPLCRHAIELGESDTVIYENVKNKVPTQIIYTNHLLINLQHTYEGDSNEYSNEYNMYNIEKIHGIIIFTITIGLVGYLLFET